MLTGNGLAWFKVVPDSASLKLMISCIIAATNWCAPVSMQMNVTTLDAELMRAMTQKAKTSEELGAAVAAKVAAEQHLNAVLVSGLYYTLGQWVIVLLLADIS